MGSGPRGVVAVDPPVVAFAGLLRQLRIEAGLSQEELAGAAGVGARTVSDLERGVALTARKDTARLLADALNLSGAARASFEAVARGRAAPGASPAPGGGAAGAGGAAATRTLPRDIGSFTGRQPELWQLVGAASGSPRPGVVSIHAIGGMAGIGKTALAVHAAHQLAPRFPDGQIFLPLHGHTPGQRPVDPADALASLLLTAGLAAAQIPPGLEARAAVWRDRLAGKQLLLLLDDAADSEQVRPLLPGSAGSLVLVTSRRHLTALEDAQTVSLDILPTGQAAELLVRLAARPGLDPRDPEVAEIIRLCGYLPLAIGMLARQLHHHPAWTAADLAADLAATRDRLQLLHAEDLSVAAAFDLSYTDLTPAQQRLFRCLGLHPGSDIDAYAAAALDGTDLTAARRGLDALYDQYLLTEPGPGRYRMHDLIREHARVLAGRVDPDDDRDGAVARLLDYYQQAAGRAGALIARQARPAPAAADGAVLAAVPGLADRDQALAWARAERASLLACLDHATGTGQHARVIALTAGLAGLMRLDGPWADAITRHTAAVQAAWSAGDRLSEANALGDLGETRNLAADYPAAAQALEQALGIYRDLGDRLGQAGALQNLGNVLRVQSDFAAAAELLEQALAISRDTGYPEYYAGALWWLGDVRRATGDYPAAAELVEQALGILRDLGDPLGQVGVLSSLGDIRLATGDYPAAAEALEQALAICRDIGDRADLASVLCSLGDLRLATGDYPAAAEALEQALAICCDIGYPGCEVTTLNHTGTLHRVRGDLAHADVCHQQALALARAIGSSWDEAHALAGLGRCALAAGRTAEAEDRLRLALEIFQRIGAAEADDLAAEMDALTGKAPRKDKPSSYRLAR